MRRYIAERDWLTVYQLPPYAPDLNPVEGNWCMNHGGRAELADAMQAIAEDVKAGLLDPSKVSEKTIQKYMYYPDMPNVDLFLQPSGEQRTSKRRDGLPGRAVAGLRPTWPVAGVSGPAVRRAIPNEALLAMDGRSSEA
jgi:undecaprenyl diphosphate synthase